MATIAPATTPVTSVTIIGRRWFQKTYGNTYHSATVYVNGQAIGSTGIHYGYGDQYIETGLALLDERGLVPARERHANGSHEARWQWAERIGITFATEVSDVRREKDL